MISSLISEIQGKAPLDLPKEIAELLTFDKLNNKWIIEDIESQRTFEYNDILERWLPQSPNPGYNDDTVTDSKKRKRNFNNENDNENENENDDDISKQVKRLKKEKIDQLKAEKQQLKELERNQNKCIYISHLAKDTKYEELERIFSKYGIIAIDLNTGEKRIKMYKNDLGNFKGDCLIEYLREESCNLAIDLLDDTLFNPWDGERISVTKAEFSKSKSKSKPNTNDTTKNVEKPKKTISYKDKIQRQKRLNELNKKISNWSDSESESELESESNTNSEEYQTTVILKHCFTLDEIKKDPESILDIKDDVQEGCEELGQVLEVIVYDLEPEGIVSVKFKTVQGANECIRKMDGRYFGGQRLKVLKWDGIVRFRKTKT